MSATSLPAGRFLDLGRKRLFFLAFAMMTLFVIYRYEVPFMDKHSPIWQHFGPNVRWWLLPHGIAGAAALLLAPMQFSNSLRQRYLRMHRIAGRVYVGAVLVAAPFAIPIAKIQGPPELVMAASMQASGWVITTLIALYCIRSGNVQQHRQWMVRSYPFAMVFVVTRVLLAVPAIERMGMSGIIQTVWTTVFAAAFLPSIVLSWQAIKTGKKMVRGAGA